MEAYTGSHHVHYGINRTNLVEMHLVRGMLMQFTFDFGESLYQRQTGLFDRRR